MSNDDEEEIIVYAEFSGMLHEEALYNPNLTFKLIGIEGNKPLLQIGDEIFEGEYEDSLGTNVVFENDSQPSKEDTVFSKEVSQRLQYLTKTNKVLKFNRIFIREKNSDDLETSDEPAKFVDSYDDALKKLDECYVNEQSRLISDDVLDNKFLCN